MWLRRDVLLTLVTKKIVPFLKANKLVECLFLKKQITNPALISCTQLKAKPIDDAFSKAEQKTDSALAKKKVESYNELVALKSKFQNPKSLIDLVLNDYIEIDRSKAPVLSIEPILNGYWKAVYKFEWPVKFTVEGKFKLKEHAIDYVYLKSCDFLEYFGLIRKNELVDTKSILFHDLVLNARLYHIKTKPLVKTWKIRAKEEGKNKKIWVCKIVIDWPHQITVESFGTNEENAMRNARVLLIYRLKTMGFMDSTNRIHVISHRVYERVVNSYRERLMKRHDFELYSDASPFGFGAFVIDMNNSAASVDYLCARFPQEYMHRLAKIYNYGKKWPSSNLAYDLEAKMNNRLEEMMLEQENQLLEAQLQNRHFRKSNLEIYRQFPGYDSNMAEIYACLTALFTWKKLMKNSTVLVHTDNSAVVRAFNGPNSKQLDDFLPRQRQDVQDSTIFGEPLKEELLTRFSILLFEISNKYSITFAAKLVHNSDNNAADSLSRFLENKFAEQLATCFNRSAAPSRTNCLFVPLDGRIEATLHPSTIQSLDAIKLLNSLPVSH